MPEKNNFKSFMEWFSMYGWAILAVLIAAGVIFVILTSETQQPQFTQTEGTEFCQNVITNLGGNSDVINNTEYLYKDGTDICQIRACDQVLGKRICRITTMEVHDLVNQTETNETEVN